MRLEVEPLTREAFARFGDVVEAEGAAHYPINAGTAERFDPIAPIDVETRGGRARLSIVIAQPWPAPIAIRMMERHPFGSQAFVPLQNLPFLVVVGEGEESAPQRLRAFLAQGSQGVNYRRNVWHHPLLALKRDSRFLVIDRQGEGQNLEEVRLREPVYIDHFRAD
jgi:ureidoglycolate lyase